MDGCNTTITKCGTWAQVQLFPEDRGCGKGRGPIYNAVRHGVAGDAPCVCCQDAVHRTGGYALPGMRHAFVAKTPYTEPEVTPAPTPAPAPTPVGGGYVSMPYPAEQMVRLYREDEEITEFNAKPCVLS